MRLARLTAWTLLVAGGFALFAPPAPAQQPLPKKNNDAVTAVTNYRDTSRGGIPKEELKKARESFRLFAKYYADVVKHPDVWKAVQDPKVLPPGTAPPPTLEGPDGILRDIDRFLLEPGKSRLNQEPADYIRELGFAFDAAFKELIEQEPDRIVKVNAARVIAHVARTGAPAHFRTVTELIASANTPPEVKQYLFQAAAALLATPDLNDLRVRKHAADAKTVGALVKALMDCINNPGLLLPGADKPETLTEDQVRVIAYLRREAVRALAQTKFVTVPGADGTTPLYPAHTLVRIAMSDPNLLPAPGPLEAAEAAIGLCNMAPVAEQLKGGFRPIREYNADVAVEAITAAMVTFASPRAARAEDNSLPWRKYAALLAEAMFRWRPLFDPDFDPTIPTRFEPRLVPPVVEDMFKFIVPKILAPMDKVDFMGRPDPAAKVAIEELQGRLREIRNRPKRNTELFAGVRETNIEFALPKADPPKADPPKKDPVPEKK